MAKHFLGTKTGRYRSSGIIPEPFFVHSDLTTGGVWKPEDAGHQMTDHDKNGFVGRLRVTVSRKTTVFRERRSPQ